MHFIRHGESEFNLIFNRSGRDPGIVDAPLTPLGLKQAEEAAAHLADKGIKGILSSPYTRALQTASVLALKLGVGVQAEPLIIERHLYSCDIGKPLTQLKKSWPHVDFSALTEEMWWPSAKESQRDVEKRVGAFMTQWGWREEHTQLLVVSHWYFLNALTGRDVRNAEVFRHKI